mgnify:CR=1 FL=1
MVLFKGRTNRPTEENTMSDLNNQPTPFHVGVKVRLFLHRRAITHFYFKYGIPEADRVRFYKKAGLVEGFVTKNTTSYDGNFFATVVKYLETYLWEEKELLTMAKTLEEVEHWKHIIARHPEVNQIYETAVWILETRFNLFFPIDTDLYGVFVYEWFINVIAYGVPTNSNLSLHERYSEATKIMGMLLFQSV